jgi:hypothetical protein
MWRWDQGHLPYFQFDTLRQIAAFVARFDFISAEQDALFDATGLAFARPADYTPWRQYARVLRCCLLVSKQDGVAVPTPVAELLAQPGLVTADEFFHFLVRALTEPSPAFQDWRPDAAFRYPLLFSLKYLLAKASIAKENLTTLDEVIGAYADSGFVGTESQSDFIGIINRRKIVDYERIAQQNDPRQARESLKVIAQISYLHVFRSEIFVSLNALDAIEIFDDLDAIIGPRADDRDAEVRRLASLFQDGFTDIDFDFPQTVLNDLEESGFQEGTKVKRTHLTIERNSALRREFFLLRPTSVCDVCAMDTALTYPWTEKIIDLHHLLPLSSGTRVEKSGTTLDDLVPVCPSCHRAVHRFYDKWLKQEDKQDFINAREAKTIYEQMKVDFPGVQHA